MQISFGGSLHSRPMFGKRDRGGETAGGSPQVGPGAPGVPGSGKVRGPQRIGHGIRTEAGDGGGVTRHTSQGK